MTQRLLFLIITIVFGHFSYAGGYRIALQGQKQLAMGHTGVAVINSSELIFYNPGGLAFIDTQFTASIGANAIFSDINYQDEALGIFTGAENKTSFPFSGYAAYKLNDWASVGLGIYTPYGSQVAYPRDWAGSHLVNSIELVSVFIQPTLSIKLNSKMSIGGGPIFSLSGVNFNRNLDRSTTDENGNRSNVTIDQGGITAWGYNIGMFFKPNEKIGVGVNYRSEIRVKAEDGTADFRNLPATLPGNFDNVTFNATLPLPAELTVGMSYQFNEKWLVAFDINRTFWSAYESLDIFFSNGITSINPRNYQNTTNYRLGLQYVANDKFTLRGGYYFDESPILNGFFSPETPRSDSNNFTAGITLNISSRLAIDASVLYSYFEEVNASYDFYQENGQTIPFEGFYTNSSFVPGLGLTYNF
ncbi:transporter [Leptobacterium flavescens]|uniref:Transporter n=1 Tax=Leptobacterium flavescens TaxID=472055 RepID=A0A6P0UH61_9FLAO|nr:outer membrane protein transport protein [Leptobacterium flavescens]NER12584.1 transporter [Leptobacterium flavescens]